ncbi:thioredoxin reductase [Streptomyces sp. Ru73]|uniref:NAD(P)/FAD-dependent oxidoreductase n=1 Tax=Streptomyces sp. Ru73 TaxID=2080748 RepID=UPI000CDDA9D9|nr:NAD(P)/FAD-dependent oxidoreductase [Streptomyces sp. Ru73]POX37214.1 thioredoxin reductase [Streptomyces sp. Ru73]
MSERTRQERHYDVVVVGGGAAGLSGALALVRARRSVLVVDDGRPRNATAARTHNFFTRDGTPPGELLATGRAEVTSYGGEIAADAVVAAERRDAGFRVSLAAGQPVAARRLLVATGLVDELPDVPGLAERWGRDVLHCPYCHGWEVRDRAIGVLATGPLAARQALMWRQWSADVTLLTHRSPEPGPEEYERLAARGVCVVPGRVTGLEAPHDELTGVRLADGRRLPCRALVVEPRFTARADALASLGLAAAEERSAGEVVGSSVAAEPSGATDVPGVWVAGNVTSLSDQVIGAAAAGVQAAQAINSDLVDEDTRRAVAARRAAG